MIDAALMQDHIRRANPIPHVDDIDPDELAAFVALTQARKAGTTEAPAHHGARATAVALQPQRRNRAAVFAVAFILIAAIVGVAALALRGDTIPAVDEPVPSTTVHPPTTAGEISTAPLDINSLIWSRVPLDEVGFGGEGDAINSVTAGGPGLVAVGEVGGNAAIWTSPDGYMWSRVPHDESIFGGLDNSRIDSVTAGDAGLVAVGISGFSYPDLSEIEVEEEDPAELFKNLREGVSTVWFSADGTTWSPVLRYPIPHRASSEVSGDGFDHVTAAGPGFIAVGRPVLYASADGTTWKHIVRSDGVSRVVDGGPGLVGVGGGWDGAYGFTSDGVTWSRSPLPLDEEYGDVGGVEMTSLTAGGPGFVAVGHGIFDTTRAGNGEEPTWMWTSVVWTSRDGYTWSSVPLDSAVFGDSMMDKVIATDTGLLAVGTAGERGAAWTSPDGTAWTRIPYDKAFGAGAGIGDVVVGGSGIVAVGVVNDAPAIWVATPEESTDP